MNYKYEIYRKLIHLSSLWIVFIIYFFEKKLSLSILLSLTLLIFIVENARKRFFFIQKSYQIIFSKILRNHEKAGGFSGAFFVILAAFIVTFLFSKKIAATSLTVTLISDTAAALVGKKFGTHKILNKSLEGSIAFFISCALVILFSFGPKFNLIPIITISLIATISELFSNKLKIDDNLSITLATAISLQIFV